MINTGKKQLEHFKVDPLSDTDTARMHQLCPNSDELYLGLDARRYLEIRIKQLESYGIIKNQALSLQCGFCASQLHALYSPNLKPNRYGKRPYPNWEHAAKLHVVTRGFIHAKYTNPEYWAFFQKILKG